MKQNNTWHIMHFIITIATGGLWLPVWIIIILMNSSTNSKNYHKASFEQNQKILNELQNNPNKRMK